MFTNPTPKAAGGASDADLPPARKFLFEQTFENAGGPRVPERKPVTLKPDQVDELKKQSYDLGFTAGQNAGADEQSRAILASLNRLDEQLAALIKNMSEGHQQREIEMRHTVMAIARKILPSFAASNGLQEIQAILSEVVGDMVHEPRLVVRVNETQFDAINSRLQDITVKKAYAGSVVVLSDDALAPGDCRVEWADGGIERNLTETLNDIQKIVVPSGAASAPSPKE